MRKNILLALVVIFAFTISNTNVIYGKNFDDVIDPDDPDTVYTTSRIIEDVMDPGGGGTTGFTQAILTIYSDGSSDSSSSSFSNDLSSLYGTHSFIHIENTGDEVIVVGVYYLYPDEDVTIGIYGNQDLHSGVWYNLEAYFNYNFGGYDSGKGLSMTIDENDVEEIDYYIDNNYDIWSLDYNCSSFASDIWNLVSSNTLEPYDDFLNYDTPKHLAEEIDDISGYFEGVQFTVNSTIVNKVGYYGVTQTGYGTFVIVPQN